MNALTCKKAWLTAPICFIVGFGLLILAWAVMSPAAAMDFFDQGGFAPFEWMTLPVFALIIPLVWLCPPIAGSTKKQAFWAIIWSILSVMAIVRETDLHKALFANLWPEVAAGFKGTVFKMRFLTAWDMPIVPRLFVLFFFILFFAGALIPLAKYILPLIKGFFKLEPVAWSAAFFGISSVIVLIFDRFPAWYRHAMHDTAALGDSARAFCAILEEGGEMMMALLALLALLQSYLIFNNPSKKEAKDVI